MVEIPALESSVDAANFLRCVSGAFHNLAGTLYQAGKHGAAIGFLQDACSLGMKALNMRQTTTANPINKKADEGWTQLEEQLYRRWELLGVCYSKIGDRKVDYRFLLNSTCIHPVLQQAFEALTQCIISFPYAKLGFPEQTNEHTPSALYDLSTGTKQLGTLVDRLSYLGACELLMDGSRVSLASLDFGNPVIIGVLLERQVESLEAHRWRESVQPVLARLLIDTLRIYTQNMPIRRARVLLKCMDFAYHAGPEALAGIGLPDRMGLEIEQLLESKASFPGVLFARNADCIIGAWTRCGTRAIPFSISSFGTFVACFACTPTGRRRADHPDKIPLGGSM
jgi:separase